MMFGGNIRIANIRINCLHICLLEWCGCVAAKETGFGNTPERHWPAAAQEDIAMNT